MNILENNKKVAKDFRQSYRHGEWFPLYEQLIARYERFKSNRFSIEQSIDAGSLLPFEGAIFYILKEKDKLEKEVSELTRQRDFYKTKYDATLKAVVN